MWSCPTLQSPCRTPVLTWITCSPRCLHGSLGGALALPPPDPVMWFLGLDLKGKQRELETGGRVQPAAPGGPGLVLTHLLTQLLGDPGLVLHRVEKLHLQLLELLVELWPVLLAQQKLEYAALGSGAVLLHVRGDVAAIGKEGSLLGPSDNSQPWAHLVPGAACPGEGTWGSPICREPAGAVLCLAQARLLAPTISLVAFFSHSSLGSKQGFLATSLISGSSLWPAFPMTMLLLTSVSSLWPRGAPS